MIDNCIRTKAAQGIDILIKYHDCFGYLEFGDTGNACYKPYRDDDQDAVNEMMAAIRSEMPKHSNRHIRLSEAVAKDIGSNWLSYDWLCKATARILAGEESMEELEKQGEFARFVQKRMKEKGIAELHAMADIY